MKVILEAKQEIVEFMVAEKNAQKGEVNQVNQETVEYLIHSLRKRNKK